MRQHLLYIMLLLAAFFTSCSDDAVREGGEYAEGVMTRVSLSVSSRRAGTRATGTPEDAAYDIEKIHDWWVVFVDRGGIVRTIVTRPTDRTDYVEEERIEVDVPTGTYTLYAFANISQQDLKTMTGVSFTVGSTYAANSAETAQIKLLQDWDNTVDIPMSGKQSVTVTGRANEVFSVEVVRMLAKMDIRYSNESVKEITINSIKMAQSPGDYIPLLPNYTYLDSGWPVGPASPSADLLGTVNGEYSEVNKDGTNNHPYTKISDGYWTVDLHKFGSADPNWYSRIFWITGKSVSPSDAVEVSMTLNAQYAITGLVVGLIRSSDNDIPEKGRGAVLNLMPGVDTPVHFVLSGLDYANLRLQINAAYSAENHNLLHIKDVKVNKVSSRVYLRDYPTLNPPYVKLQEYNEPNPAASWTDRFYMRESQANYNITQRYLMTVNITRYGGHPEDLLFALTKNLSSIYRNDHIVLPIVLSDYMVSLDVNFYPPIGGYPAVISRESEEEFVCEFATQGTFEILPQVVNASSGYAMVYNTGNPHYTYSITGVSDPSGIFSVTPEIEVGTGEMLGELNTKEGIAYVDVEIVVHRTDVADQLYERRIYIIRKNA